MYCISVMGVGHVMQASVRISLDRINVYHKRCAVRERAQALQRARALFEESLAQVPI